MRGGRIPYSAEELAWVKANCTLTATALAAAFNERFGRDLTPENLKSLRTRNGWEAGRKGKGVMRAYSPEEFAWLKANHKLPIGEYAAKFTEQFGRAVEPNNLANLRKRQGWMTGRTGQFVKGQESHNKGKRCPEGVGGRHPNARRTQFKKGGEPHNTKHLGHERVNTDGYVEISVAETNPHTGYERRYVHKHVHLWEKANGPVPEGHCLKCIDGDKTNTAPSNWEAIPRAVLPLLNGGRASIMHYDSAPAELKPAVLTAAKLKHAIKSKRKAKAQ